MSKPALSLSAQPQTEWDASDALIEKRAGESRKIWESLNRDGDKAVQGLMIYLSHIEGQNKRLNKRVELLEAMAMKYLGQQPPQQSQCDLSTQKGNGHDGNT